MKETPKLIRRRLPIEHNVYRRAITVLCGSLDQINTALRRECENAANAFEPIPPSSCGHWRVVEMDGYENDFIAIRDGLSSIELTSAVVHECFHHVSHALPMAGMPLTEGSEEAYAYYLQWLVEQVLNVVGVDE